MAEESAGEKTEEPTQERIEEFREKGQIAVSRELGSVFVLSAAIAFLSIMLDSMSISIQEIFLDYYSKITSLEINKQTIFDMMFATWKNVLWIILPLFVTTISSAMFITFAQTRLNFSIKKLKPDFSRMNIFKGIAKMFSLNSIFELAKGIAKMLVVSLISYLVLYGERFKLPGLITWSTLHTWKYWGSITQQLAWSVAAILLVIGILDYIYNYIQLMNKMRMSKQEVKDESKKREVDPQVKGRMKKIQREILNSETIKTTKEATVLITNPTHFAVALKYELGMGSPMVIAKGSDHLALKMREVAKEAGIPIIENKPLARDMFANVDEGEFIPSRLYKAVAEIIRYVLKIKGKKV